MAEIFPECDGKKTTRAKGNCGKSEKKNIKKRDAQRPGSLGFGRFKADFKGYSPDI